MIKKLKKESNVNNRKVALIYNFFQTFPLTFCVQVFYPSTAVPPRSGHLLMGLLFGLGGAVVVLAAMIVIYV